MKTTNKVVLATLVASVLCLTVACSKKDTKQASKETNEDLTLDHTMSLEYANNFSVDYFKGGYKKLSVKGQKSILLVPEGKKTPTNDLDADIILQMPVSNLLAASTSTLSLLNSLNRIDAVTLTTTKRSSWHIDNVVNAIDNGTLSYIGKYSEPDYEMIATQSPSFAIYSAMIKSAPEVGSKLDELNIPYLIDQSSYEEHALGRVEWVKFYGALLDCEDKADEVFSAQSQMVNSFTTNTKSPKKTVAAFFITSKNILYARNGGDYVSEMINIAGGDYIFNDINSDKAGTMTMGFEDFYSKTKDVDYIIYIWSIGGKPATLKEFSEKNALFEDFKAVKNGNVWCTGDDFFQSSDCLGYIIKDINTVLTSDNPSDTLDHLFRLK